MYSISSEYKLLEDYVRLIGKLHRMGVGNLISEFHLNVDGVIRPWFVPGVYGDIMGKVKEHTPEPGAPKSKRFIQLLCEGMDYHPNFELLNEGEIEEDSYAICLLVDKADLCEAIKKAIKDNDVSIDEIKEKVTETAEFYTEYLYTKKYIPSDTKEKFTTVCEQLRSQYRKRMQGIDWMSDASKSYAIEKLDAMKFNIAYTDNWREHLFPTLAQVEACSSFLEAYMLLCSSESSYCLELDGKPVKDYQMESWIIRGHSVADLGATYDTETNAIYISSTLLVPPMISPDVTEAYTYAVFSIICHEMTHGFDTDGVKYDKDGIKNPWMSEADKAIFEERQKLLVESYNQLEIAPDLMPGVFCNGTVTLEENITDLGGLHIALDAYTERLQQQVEKPRAFDPRGQAKLTPEGKIRLTLSGKIKLTPEKQLLFRGFFVVLSIVLADG